MRAHDGDSMRAHDGCHVEPVEPDPVDERRLERSASLWLSVSDMGCPNCALRVRNAILGVPGVLDARVDLPAGLVAVAYEGERAAPEQMVAAVERAGAGTRHDYRAAVLRAH